ncbi:DUF7344 domain-containing protein [Natronococcus jeotgali]
MEDKVSETLSNTTRCQVLETLNDRNRPVQVAALTEPDNAEEQLRVQKIALVHNHLPKLHDLDFVEWDRKQGIIKKGSQFDEIQPYLDNVSWDDPGGHSGGCP